MAKGCNMTCLGWFAEDFLARDVTFYFCGDAVDSRRPAAFGCRNGN